MENIKEEFEKKNSTRDWFVEGGRVDHDTPEKYVYDDFTTDMCWTCFFDAYNTQRLRADTAEAELKVTKQAIASLKNERASDDRKFKCLGEILGLLKDHPIVKAHQLHIDAALNPNPEAESHE